uniref:Uncharacterized protein n=1 Tax=Candidatus Kentrum sp. FW TaxID=2126338 RepID=A0A450SNS5_9GAMM|nr:MAG: hypothetical protein BECKFW1821A_GA0114235_10545 [Candidatus Kentron sp. FW]
MTGGEKARFDVVAFLALQIPALSDYLPTTGGTERNATERNAMEGVPYRGGNRGNFGL